MNLRQKTVNSLTLAITIAIAFSGCASPHSGIVRPVAPASAKRDFDYDSIILSRRPAMAQEASATFANSARPTMPKGVHLDWIPNMPERRWAWIVIHHSATPRGNAEIFDKHHRNSRHWDELGYHFVIGNGSGSDDGQVETGPRWVKQKHGAHCKVPGHDEYNQVGIGICLVGNFSRTRPSAKQMQSLAELLRWLASRYRIPKSHIIRHCDVKDTDCPGKHFPFNDLLRDVFGEDGR